MDQPTFDVTARIPTDTEHVRENVPGWCDLVLEVSRDGQKRYSGYFTRATGELMLEALHRALHPHSGRSVGAILAEKLDEVIARLEDDQATEQDIGRAQALTWAIAVMRNPYDPPYEAIQAEAMERRDASR